MSESVNKLDSRHRQLWRTNVPRVVAPACVIRPIKQNEELNDNLNTVASTRDGLANAHRTTESSCTITIFLILMSWKLINFTETSVRLFETQDHVMITYPAAAPVFQIDETSHDDITKHA